jgi:hypothetical protein
MRQRISGKGLLLVAGCCCFWLLLGRPVLTHAYENDFLCYYIGGTLARQGRFADLYRPEAQMEVQKRVAPPVAEVRPYVRPPWFAIALAPLTLLPLVSAYIAWVGVMLLMTLAEWAWSFARFGERGLVLSALFLPLNLGLFFGQDCAVMLAVFCVFYVLWEQQNLFRSGAALGLGLIKPHLLVLLPVWMVWQKRWRMLAGFAAVAATLFAVSLLLLGTSGVAGYVNVLVHGKTELGPSPQSMPNIYSVPINFGVRSANLNVVLAAVILILGIGGLRRASMWRALGIASAGSLLISPHVFGYDAALLLLPIWLVTSTPTSKASRYSALLLSVPFTFLLTLAPRPLACVPALAVLAFFVALVADSSEEKLAPAGSVVEAKAQSSTLA